MSAWADETSALAVAAGVNVVTQVFDPWRFDVARNHALSLIPDDVDLCISLDLDEVMVPGWRAALEASIYERHGHSRPDSHLVAFANERVAKLGARALIKEATCHVDSLNFSALALPRC